MVSILPVEQTLIERVRWLIRLRWVAAAGVAVTVVFAYGVLRLPLEPLPLSLTVVGILLYNLIFHFHQRRSALIEPAQARLRGIYQSFHAQIALDWIALTVLLHYAGGIENPFLMYFIFHAILAGILLSRRSSYAQAALAILLISLMTLSEATGILPHSTLGRSFGFGLHDDPLYIGVLLFVFATTIFLAVYLTTEITTVLRTRERESARLDESLREANEALLEKDRARSEYILRVSHDLQSPLAATHSMLSLVIETMSESMPEKGREFLQRSLRRVEGLLRLARGLFDLSRIRASRTLAIEPIPLKQIVEAAAQDMLMRPGKGGCELTIDIPSSLPFVAGDKDHLEMAFIHLLTNAAQYSLPGVRISVRAHTAGEWMEVTVQDTGIGIPYDEIPRIYEEFYRGSMAKEMEPSGWGLGLTLVRHIIDRHGGTIRVESEVGKGSRFTLTLPIYTTSSQ